MSGQIKALIERLIEKRAGGNPVLMTTTKTKLMIKGINIDIYTDETPDDPQIIEKLYKTANEWGVEI